MCTLQNNTKGLGASWAPAATSYTAGTSVRSGRVCVSRAHRTVGPVTRSRTVRTGTPPLLPSADAGRNAHVRRSAQSMPEATLAYRAEESLPPFRTLGGGRAPSGSSACHKSNVAGTARAAEAAAASYGINPCDSEAYGANPRRQGRLLARPGMVRTGGGPSHRQHRDRNAEAAATAPGAAATCCVGASAACNTIPRGRSHQSWVPTFDTS